MRSAFALVWAALAEDGTQNPSTNPHGADSAANRDFYNEWGGDKYNADVRQWGYDAPEVVTKLVVKHLPSELGELADLHVLDAGIGTGLQGKSLRAAGFARLTGIDQSAELLAAARGTGDYANLHEADMNARLDLFQSGAFHVVVCVGVLTYLDPALQPNGVEEMLRVTRVGGLVAFTSRDDKVKDWAATIARLTKRRSWEKVYISDPEPYLPNNAEFADKVKVIYHVFRKLAPVHYEEKPEL